MNVKEWKLVRKAITRCEELVGAKVCGLRNDNNATAICVSVEC